MSDSENRKLVGMIIDCAKLTPEIFAKAVEDTLNNILNKKPQGKTSLGTLMKTGKVENIEVNDSNIGSFAQTARKYKLTYALKRTLNEDGKKQYLVCFHAKDLDTMQRAFKEYTYKQTHRKPSLFSKARAAEIAKEVQEQRLEHSNDRNRERKKQRSDISIG